MQVQGYNFAGCLLQGGCAGGGGLLGRAKFIGNKLTPLTNDFNDFKDLKDFTMLNRIHLSHFKGFTNTQIGPLRKVNLILGGQNVGKTSLLEAVHGCANRCMDDLGGVFRQAEGNDVQRFAESVLGSKDWRVDTWWASISGFEQRYMGVSPTLAPMRTTVDIQGNELPVELALCAERAAYIHASIDKPFIQPITSAIPVHLSGQQVMRDLYGAALKRKNKQALIELLQAIEPRLNSLDDISLDGEQRLCADLKDQTEIMPVQQLGHGFNRLIFIYASLLSTNSELMLIDEVENGIHYSALPVLMRGIQQVALNRNVQTLMTTHSWDCIRAACETFAERPEDFQLIRLERVKDGQSSNIKAVCIPTEQALRMVQNDMEMR